MVVSKRQAADALAVEMRLAHSVQSRSLLLPNLLLQRSEVTFLLGIHCSAMQGQRVGQWFAGGSCRSSSLAGIGAK